MSRVLQEIKYEGEKIIMLKCNFENCKYCVAGNCISQKEYDACDYAEMARKKEIMCEVLSVQGVKSIWSSDQAFRGWLERGINCVRELDKLGEQKIISEQK